MPRNNSNSRNTTRRRIGNAIPQNNDPRQTVKNPIISNVSKDKIWLELKDTRWLTSLKYKDFSNYLKDSEECYEHYSLVFSKIIPKVLNEWETILPKQGSRQYQHCHILNGKSLELARNLFQKIYNYEMDQALKIWQFGFTGSVRIICIHLASENALVPLFIDQHHLIDSDVNYNEKEYGRYQLTMMK